MPIHENSNDTTESPAKTVKYRISEQLSKFSAQEKAKKRQQIIERCGLHAGTFSNWINLPSDSPRQIGAEDLQIIAEVLGCEITDLLPIKTQ